MGIEEKEEDESTLLQLNSQPPKTPSPDLSDDERLLNLFENARYYLLPSFFKTLIYLKKSKREFAVILRGEDELIDDAVFEFNKFCQGTHPCYNGKAGTPTIKFDGSKGNKRCIIDD